MSAALPIERDPALRYDERALTSADVTAAAEQIRIAKTKHGYTFHRHGDSNQPLAPIHVALATLEAALEQGLPIHLEIRS
ncbi:MAG TPA: hypothetical protein VME63_02440 [Dyella sp.]|uniref:hypothetical protein n=1 Tax=Dyella sp. TaxID=1869338 RepID=UPI002CD3C9B2|nr:hypothetical protein [Dyella sp.]HTV84233.1 hypothetical protein [Dyella sp.]